MKITIDDGCENCGGVLVLDTEAEQYPGAYAWWADEDDEAICIECAAVHTVSLYPIYDRDDGDPEYRATLRWVDG